MSNDDFIINMLNLHPDSIQNITTKTVDDLITVSVSLREYLPVVCPLCGSQAVKNGTRSKLITHSTFNNRKCVIRLIRHRYLCKNCSHSFSERNPFSYNQERLSAVTKINILTALKDYTNTYASVARNFNVSQATVMRLFDKHVKAARKPLPEVLSIDEIYFPTSDYDSKYICVLIDFCSGTVVDILPSRKKFNMSEYFANIRNETLEQHNKSELKNVKYVSIDMYENYLELSETYFPDAVVCVDSFHVIEHLTEAFRQVRLSCRRKTDDDILKYLLSRFKYIFNYDFKLDNDPRYNRKLRRKMNYRQIMNYIFDRLPELKKAYDIKQNYIYSNSTSTYEKAAENLAALIKQITDADIREFDEFNSLLIHWRNEIINSFTVVNGERINNSKIESKNNLIKRLFLNANGFRNFSRTKARIMYCLNDDTFKL